MRLQHISFCRLMELVHVQQLGNRRLHWLRIAVDCTSRHEALYVHCTVGGTSNPDQLSSWWLLGVCEDWATLYAAAQEVHFNQQLWDASKDLFQRTAGVLPIGAI